MLLAPGPVNLHPKVRETLALPMIHHRTPEFDRILAQTLTKLKSVFQTQEHAFILTSTGSGGMECLLVNCMHPGDEVLVIDSGKFGERWAEMVSAFGGKLHVLKVPWGQSVQPSAVEEYLLQNKNIKIVTCQACETSTAVAHPIQEISKRVHQKSNALFLVDAITALGAYDLPFDAWEIDGMVGGSQKAFMLPTGLAFVAFSKRAWARIEGNSLPRFYFDIRKELAANKKGETFFSSNVQLIRALDTVLDLIHETGLQSLFSTISKRAEFTRAVGAKLGLELYSQSPSPSVTALQVPKDIDSQKLRQNIELKYGITIMGGQDQLKGKILRIGHMGHITNEDQLRLAKTLYQALAEMNPNQWPISELQNFEANCKEILESL
jgi:aspartate aminotransferase-like enzyme